MHAQKPSTADRVTELFERAIGLPPAERAAFLTRECGDNRALREEVESLLTHDAEASHGFMRTLDRPDDVGSDADPIPTATIGSAERFLGRRIGRYRVKSLIASGGMGTVYLAQQDRPRRDVALKIMHAGVASRDAMRRFEFESQVLARLRHPHIACVFEAGVHEPSGGPPVPYFAMEYVPDARPITRYADEHKLDTKQRLALFARVCDAVHHGHQRGVIHRDLKPGNILVDVAGEPKVIDFGVARSTDSDVAVTTMRTDVGQLIGTLQYMSPEQCDADPHGVDTRSDVYSLGAVLYELLTGSRPYDATGTSIYRATRIIKEAIPPSPSSIKRQLRGDIETIVIKALEKEPARRYQSAGELGNDIRHVLRREPIEARTPTLWSRAVRWMSRHPVASAAALATVVALVIIALLPGVTWWYGSRVPYKVMLADDQRRVDLVSLLGKTLFTWDDGVFVKPRLLRYGEARRAVIGFLRSPAPRFDRRICVFDAYGPYDEPIWTSRLTKTEMPRFKRAGFTPEDFAVATLDSFDVFPEIEGPEIVASFSNSYSMRAVQIYSFDGRLLYQIWHDGAVYGFYWLAGPRLLIVVSEDARCYWEYRGFPDIKERYPYVLFALRPRVGHVSTKVLDLECREGPDCPVWAKYVAPPRMTDIFGEPELRLPAFARYGQKDHFNVDFFLRQSPGVGVSRIVDQHGNIVGSEATSDAFKRLENPPDLSGLHLADIRELPACPEPAAEDASPANPAASD